MLSSTIQPSQLSNSGTVRLVYCVCDFSLCVHRQWWLACSAQCSACWMWLRLFHLLQMMRLCRTASLHVLICFPALIPAELHVLVPDHVHWTPQRAEPVLCVGALSVTETSDLWHILIRRSVLPSLAMHNPCRHGGHVSSTHTPTHLSTWELSLTSFHLPVKEKSAPLLSSITTNHTSWHLQHFNFTLDFPLDNDFISVAQEKKLSQLQPIIIMQILLRLSVMPSIRLAGRSLVCLPLRDDMFWLPSLPASNALMFSSRLVFFLQLSRCPRFLAASNTSDRDYTGFEKGTANQ